MGSYIPISRIAIIGAGPVGVAFAKYLLAEKAFSKIDIFEQRDRVGGVWNLSPTDSSKSIPIPQTNPKYGQEFSDNSSHRASQQSLEFESPLYDYLETNIPKGLMAYSDKPFSEDAPLFPRHETVLKYLEEYAEDVKHLIRFNHQVKDLCLHELSTTEHEVWRIKVEELPTSVTSIHTYDAVVVANGHYTIPNVPQIEGIAEWSKAYPGAVLHSKAYRKPQDFKNAKVIVIGNSASGLDIAHQVARCCRKPVLLSSRSVSAFGTMPPADWREDVDEIVEFLSPETGSRAVRFQSGRVEHDVDYVIFATGYFYSFPFLSQFEPPLVTDGFRTRGTYQHLFHIHHPTLVFPVINLKVIPFPLAENQAAVVARVWSGRLNLPSKASMIEWEVKTAEEKGSGKYFHLKGFPEDAAQINELYQWAKTASKSSALENGGLGKLGTRWDESQVWMRSRFPAIKGAYMAKGEQRVQVRTVQELGFDFDKWREHAQLSEMTVFEAAKCRQTISKLAIL